MHPNPKDTTGDRHDAVLDASDLAEALRRAVGVFVRAMRSEAGTPRSSQSETLALLADRGAMTIAALAQLRQVKHQSMRLVLAPLEEGGLVSSSVDAADRRSRAVAITTAGREALSGERTARVKAIEGRIRAALTDGERAVLAAAVPLIERLCYDPTSCAGTHRLS